MFYAPIKCILKRNGVFVLFCIFLLLSLIVLTGCTKSKTTSTRQLTAHEMTLRKAATRTVIPDFPEDSKKSGVSGVAVAQIEIDTEGDVIAVEVLQAPDLPTTRAIADAMKLWKFKPNMLQMGSVRVRGKLTFYYVTDSKGSRVESPLE